jgi:hypothetical protein
MNRKECLSDAKTLSQLWKEYRETFYNVANVCSAKKHVVYGKEKRVILNEFYIHSVLLFFQIQILSFQHRNLGFHFNY